MLTFAINAALYASTSFSRLRMTSNGFTVLGSSITTRFLLKNLFRLVVSKAVSMEALQVAGFCTTTDSFLMIGLSRIEEYIVMDLLW